MTANELRIGNYLKTDNSTEHFEDVIIVESIQHNGINITDGHGNSSQTEFEWDFLKSVPLTEKWLLKFGFAKDKNGFFTKVFNKHGEEFIISNYGSINGSEKGFVANEDFRFKRIKHVHQLQNLYSALTGEELILKSE
jgi:hypothetical protein